MQSFVHHIIFVFGPEGQPKLVSRIFCYLPSDMCVCVLKPRCKFCKHDFHHQCSIEINNMQLVQVNFCQKLVSVQVIQ